jgi:exosortase
MTQQSNNNPPASVQSPAQPGNGNLAESAAPEANWMGLPQSVWIQAAVVAVLFCSLFWPNLRRLWDKTNPFYGEANWGHAIGVPIIGLYYLYVNREKLINPDPAPRFFTRHATFLAWGMFVVALLMQVALVHQEAHDFFKRATIVVAILSAASFVWWRLDPNGDFWKSAAVHSAGWFGGSIAFFGIEFFAYGIYPGQNDFFKDVGMVITLFGVVLALGGWGVMRTAWFPVLFLMCGVPWSGLMYSRIASPLQQLAAHVAVNTLQLTGVEASAGGTKIFIVGYGGTIRTLNVAEACAGLRSLMTFISVGAAVAFLSNRALWQKIGITLSAIPIAIFCNVMRVSGQGLLDHYVSQQLSENFAHQFVGMIMLIPAFLLILLVGWLLDQIFVQEADHRKRLPKMIRRATVVEPVRTLPRPGLAVGRAAAVIAGAGRTPAVAGGPAMVAPSAIPRKAPTKISTPSVAAPRAVAPKTPVPKASAPKPANGAAPRTPSPTPPPSIRLATGPRRVPSGAVPPAPPRPVKPPAPTAPTKKPNPLRPDPKREAP